MASHLISPSSDGANIQPDNMTQLVAAPGRQSRISRIVRETVIAFVVTFLLGGFFAWVVELSHPATVLCLVIVYFAFRGGVWPGIAAALVTVGWSIYSTFQTI